ncbi:SH3 domain-containing protein [Stackebrandtia nassauensis]|nr:SH3 domain-containing protein [Stackebrandtia nassauensis]
MAGTLVSGVAHADEPEARSPHCDYVALQSVKIRAKPTTNSTALDLLAKGKRIDCDSQAQVGGKFRDCGGGDVWNRVNYKGRKAWVASNCVRWEPS